MELDDTTFKRLANYIESELGFSVSYYNEDYLKRRITSRIRRSGCESLSDYIEYVKESSEEQSDLLHSFSINVTGFFRNEDVWIEIRRILRRETHKKNTYSVWSAGCADGREPYSIALLAVTDPKIDHTNLKVTGTDINQKALKRAREGTYRKTITNNIDEQLEFLENSNHVSWDGDEVTVSDEIKEMVNFEKRDLIRDEPPHNCDLVLCRNVFIYLKRTHERDIFETLTSAMNPNGYIIIGKAETMPNSLAPLFSDSRSSLRVYQYTGNGDFRN